jgi:hypothetical protein
MTFLIIFTGIAAAGDEQGINQALNNSKEVHLQSGVYTLEGPIYIHSGNVLTGEPDTILRVSSSSSQWFTGMTGIISCAESVKNVEISGFSIDGNCENLPFEYHHSRSDTAHDCERCILLGGFSNDHAENIKIHDLKLYDSFSDGVFIHFADNVQCYNLEISNCEHEGVYYSSVWNSLIYDNKIAGITSDCLRIDNGVSCKVYNNTLFSYSGNHSGDVYQHGENGLQLGDSGVSKGYDGRSSSKPTTTNIEVYGNVFANNGLKAILLDSIALSESANVYIHSNKFLNATELKTSGVSFDINNISEKNQPTLKQSENIFNILSQVFSFTYPDKQIDINADIQVIYYNNSFNAHSLVYVDGEGLTGVKYEYNGSSATHYFNINGLDLWEGDLSRTGNAVYLQGNFDASKLQVICYNSQGYCKITNFNITEVPDDSAKILSPELWAFLGTLAILGFSIYRNFRRIVTKW